VPFAVLDASCVAAFVFADEASRSMDALYGRALREGVAVSAIWPLEVANMVRQGEKRGRIEAANLADTNAKLLAIPRDVDRADLNIALGAILALSRKHGLTAYDASYLELALRTGLPLAMRDDELIAAARAEGVPLLPA
jgi:predicted nucleic acid-binding protein